MRHIVLVASVAVAFGAAIACSTSGSSTEEAADAGDDAGITLSPSDLPPASEGPAGTGGNTGLPCDVQAVLENRCIACHDGLSQVALLSYDNLVAPSKVAPSKTLAQLSLERMKATTNPMPPPPAEGPSADEIAIFEEWLTAGAPKNPSSCTDMVPTDGGTDGGGGGGGSDAGDAGSVCTSNVRWTMGNAKSPLMHPGAACNKCHQVLGGPNLAFAGTIYPTLHEPDDCNGKAPPPQLQVVVTDSRNKTFSMNVNEAGNFFIRAAEAGRIRAPFTARVVEANNPNKVRRMLGRVTSGDCNNCHTQAGAFGTPGRILTP